MTTYNPQQMGNPTTLIAAELGRHPNKYRITGGEDEVSLVQEKLKNYVSLWAYHGFILTKEGEIGYNHTIDIMAGQVFAKHCLTGKAAVKIRAKNAGRDFSHPFSQLRTFMLQTTDQDTPFATLFYVTIPKARFNSMTTMRIANWVTKVAELVAILEEHARLAAEMYGDLINHRLNILERQGAVLTSIEPAPSAGEEPTTVRVSQAHSPSRRVGQPAVTIDTTPLTDIASELGQLATPISGRSRPRVDTPMPTESHETRRSGRLPLENIDEQKLDSGVSQRPDLGVIREEDTANTYSTPVVEEKTPSLSA